MYIHSDRLTSLSQSTALGTKHPVQHKAPHSANTPAECLKHAAQATPKGSAHCKGPLDRLLTARYACFMPSNETISSLGYVSLISGFRDNTFAPDP